MHQIYLGEGSPSNCIMATCSTTFLIIENVCKCPSYIEQCFLQALQFVRVRVQHGLVRRTNRTGANCLQDICNPTEQPSARRNRDTAMNQSIPVFSVCTIGSPCGWQSVRPHIIRLSYRHSSPIFLGIRPGCMDADRNHILNARASSVSFVCFTKKFSP